jgi:hypothetical protein
MALRENTIFKFHLVILPQHTRAIKNGI